MNSVQILVIAKSPVPGESKTRLSPPLSIEEAAAVARASLVTTLEAVATTPASRRVLVLEGPVRDWLPLGIEVIPQRGRGLAERLANAFEDAGAPSLLIGMDTPQVSPAMLTSACRILQRPAVDAVIGPACDGGWWAIGLKRTDPRVFLGVPMSTGLTGAIQLARLHSLGLKTVSLQLLRDVDRIEDAIAVSREIAGTPFAEAVSKVVGARAG